MSKKKTSEIEEEIVEPTEQVSPEEGTEEEIQEEVQSEIDYQILWQRAMADLENTRRRYDQERLNISKYALTSFVEDLLPVVDNFYRATEHIPEDQRSSPWVTGIQYIQKQLIDALEARGVEEIQAKPGDMLDPHQHEAVETASEEGFEDDQIIEVKNRGYKMADRIIRPVQVKVNKHN